AAREAIVRGAPPAGAEVAGEFETIYAGGALGLLHAAAASRYGRRVLVFDETIGRAGRDWHVSADEVRALERAGLFTKEEIEATGPASAVARQLNEGRAITHVCPTVGAVARGFARGAGPDKVDFETGELLVSTEDASDHRQLIWGGFAGAPARDEYSTYLFFY